MNIETQDLTGLVLAGGQGRRMGGVDKGLVLLRGKPLVTHVLARLRPQVGRLMISANRNRLRYEALGLPVWADLPGDAGDTVDTVDTDDAGDAGDAGKALAYAGPLAGIASGLGHCETPWLVTVPCDVPGLPLDLVARLAAGAGEAGAGIAMAATRDETGALRHQPVFALIRTTLLASLRHYRANDGRKVDAWMQREGCAVVPFDDAAAFRGANTRDELSRLS